MSDSNNFDLSILPVVEEGNETKLKRKIHPNLPDISTGQMGILVSPVKTGKSTLISNLLLNPNFYLDLFDNVYIISNTIHNDRTSRFLKEKYSATIFDEYSDEIIDKILKYQESFSKDKRPFIAIIMDDFLGVKHKAKIFQLASRFRHYNIGLLLFASQLFKALPTVCRQNATFAIIGKNPNDSEVIKMVETFGSSFGGKDNFLRLYKEATSEKYNFLYLDLNSNPHKAFINFTELIYDGHQ